VCREVPQNVKPGDVLTGTITYTRSRDTAAGPDKHPDGFPITFTVPSSPKKPKKVRGVAVVFCG